MTKLIIFASLLILADCSFTVSANAPGGPDSTNRLRIAVKGIKDSRPAESKRDAQRVAKAKEYHSVYDNGPIVPGGPGSKQHFFVSVDYNVYDGPRKRFIPFFDPEETINCGCDDPFPTELDIPHRFAIYNPVTVQAPLPSVPKDLLTVKYSGFYYGCPSHVNPFEFAWYFSKQDLNPCRWIWYQTVQDSQ